MRITRPLTACLLAGALLTACSSSNPEQTAADQSETRAPMPVVPEPAVEKRTVASPMMEGRAARKAVPSPTPSASEVPVTFAAPGVTFMAGSPGGSAFHGTAASQSAGTFSDHADAHFSDPTLHRRQEALHPKLDTLTDNPFHAVSDQPVSTFASDVDTASYSIVKHWIEQYQRLPNADAVRIEEMIHAFKYQDAAPAWTAVEQGEAPFAIHAGLTQCPWAHQHQLMRVAVAGATPPAEVRGDAHLVFLIDTSGSMSDAKKLPLALSSLARALDQLRPTDRISVVTYAGHVSTVLQGVPVAQKRQILKALDSLGAGGSTAGASGIARAYDLAAEHFIEGGINQVVLCTDGDFNVGTSSNEGLLSLVKQKANPENGRGVYLSVCGFGLGNLNDSMMEAVTNAGNGAYHHIGGHQDAERIFGRDLYSSLVTLGKDLKIQIEFNPAHVGHYRLIGFENRLLKREDFNDDTVDAGDVGAGHRVIALYELVPPGILPQVDALRYQANPVHTDAGTEPAVRTDELAFVKVRWKPADAKAEQGISRLLEQVVRQTDALPFADASDDMRFAAALAAFGMNLRHSPHKGSSSLAWALATARDARGEDPSGDRQGFVELCQKALQLQQQQQARAGQATGSR